MENKNTKHGLTVRGDSLYCPLPLSIEPYFWCSPNCPSCYFRGLNHIWGKEYRPLDLDALENKLTNGLKNKTPKSFLAHCLVNKKTIRLGNKADAFQPIEETMKRSSGAIEIMDRLDWSYVVQTRFPSRAWNMNEEIIVHSSSKGLVTMLPIISPGMELDQQVLEAGRTEPIKTRLETISKILKRGVPLGVQGEPFVPGFHTVAMFEDAIKRLKALGVKRYNTYNFHFTPHVAKRLAKLPEIDIEKIWTYNQDGSWKPILAQLIEIAKKYDMILGCPDFVNSGVNHYEEANTCCGIDVPNPCTFNTHYFKALAQKGMLPEDIISQTYDGSGDIEEGRDIINGTTKDMYTLKDAGVCTAPFKRIKKEKGSFGL